METRARVVVLLVDRPFCSRESRCCCYLETENIKLVTDTSSYLQGYH